MLLAFVINIVAQVVFMFFLSALSMLFFLRFLLEYYVVRHDLSEAQLNSITEHLPNFIKNQFNGTKENWLLNAHPTIEYFIKHASYHLAIIGMVIGGLLGPLVNLGNAYFAITRNEIVSAFLYGLFFVGWLYIAFRLNHNIQQTLNTQI